MPRNDGPEQQNAQQSELDEVTAANRAASAEPATTPDKHNPITDPQTVGEKLAANNERLQNAGFQDTPFTTQSVKATNNATGNSTRNSARTFEEQTNSAQLSTVAKKRGRKGRRYIPDSLPQLAELLENALSEEHLAQVLEKAIEDRSNGALAVSKNEIQEAAEEIFQHVREALANGELSEVDTEAIQRRLGELFSHDNLILSEEDLHWLSDTLKDLAPELIQDLIEKNSKTKIHHRDFLRIAKQLSIELERDPSLIGNTEQLARTVTNSVELESNWIQQMNEDGRELFIEHLMNVIEAKVPSVVTTDVSTEIAEQLIFHTTKGELAPVIEEIVRGELVAEYREEKSSVREELLQSHFSLLKEFPTLESYLEREIDRYKEEIKSEVTSELTPLVDLSQSLFDISKEGPEAKLRALGLLVQLDSETALLIQEMFEDLHGESLDSALGKIFEGNSSDILEGIVSRDEVVLKAIHSRLLAETLEDTASKADVSDEVKAKLIDQYVSFLSSDGQGVIERYEELFGEATTQLDKFEGEAALLGKAKILSARDGDQALLYAIEIQESGVLDKKGARYGEPLLALAEELKRFPSKDRKAIIAYLTDEFENPRLQSLLKNYTRSIENRYLEAVLNDDDATRIACSFRLVEQEQYHSLVDILALYSEEKDNPAFAEAGTRYKELFDEELKLADFKKTQVDEGKDENIREISAKVRASRTRLLRNIKAGEALDQEALHVVLAHEATVLASRTAEYEVHRSGGLDQTKELLAREKEELEAAAKLLDQGKGIAPLILDVAYSETYFAERHEWISREVWSLTRDQRFSQGTDNLTPLQSRQNTEELEKYLDSVGIKEGKLREALRQHSEESREHFNVVFEEMRIKAVHIRSSLKGMNFTHDQFARLISNGEFKTDNKLFEAARDTTARRDWGLTKAQVRALEMHFRDINGGESLSHYVAKEFWNQRREDQAQWALNAHYAPEDSSYEQSLQNLNQFFSRTSAEQLLSRVQESDPTTMRAIELRQALLSGEPLAATLDILSGEDAAQLLTRVEELYGGTFLQQIERDLIASEDIVIPGNLETGQGQTVINEKTILTQVVRELSQEGDNPKISDELFEQVHLYSLQRLSRFAEVEARLEAGSIVNRGLRAPSFIQYDREALVQTVKERKQFQKFLDSIFSDEARGVHRTQFQNTRRNALVASVVINRRELERLAAVTSGFEDETLKALHRAAADGYPPASLSYLSVRTLSNGETEEINMLVKDDPYLQKWLASEQGKIAATVEKDFSEAVAAVQKIYGSMHEGFWTLFGYTDTERLNKALRGLTPEQRQLVIELYEYRNGVSLREEFQNELEGSHASQTFAEMRGEHLYSDQLAIYHGVRDFWGNYIGDSQTEEASHRIAATLEQEAREQLVEEAAAKEVGADQNELSGNIEEARTLRISAYNLREASTSPIAENVLLQNKIKELQGEFWSEFDRNFKEEDLDRETLFDDELGDPKKIKAIYLAGADPNDAWRLQFEQAIDNNEVNDAVKLLQQERQQFLDDLISFEVKLSENGKIQSKIKDGKLLIDGEEISPEMVQEYYLSTLIQASAQLQTQKQTLIRQGVDPAVIGEIEQASKKINDQISELQNGTFSEFASAFDVALLEDGELNTGSDVVTSEAEAIQAILENLFIDPVSGAPNAQHIQGFEQYVSQKLLPRYRTAIAKGTIFQDEKLSSVAEAWQARIGELNENFQTVHGEGITIESFIKDHCWGQKKERLLAELNGDLITAAFLQVRQDITGDGEGDTLAVAAILPAELLRFQDDLDRQLVQLERAVPQSVLTQVRQKSEARREILMLEERLSQGKGDKEALEHKVDELKDIEKLSIDVPQHSQHIVQRYLTVLKERDEVRDAIQERGQEIEAAYNARFGLQYERPNGEKVTTAGMWDHLASDLGSTDAEVYRGAVMYGELTDAMRLRVAIAGLGTDEAMIWRALGDPSAGVGTKTIEELTEIAEEFAKLEGKDSLTGKKALDYMFKRVDADVSGDDQWKVNLVRVGRPSPRVTIHPETGERIVDHSRTVRQMSQILELHDRHLNNSLIDIPVPERYRFDKLNEQYQDQLASLLGESDGRWISSISDEELKSRLHGADLRELNALFNNAAITAVGAVHSRNVAADLIVEGVSTCVVVVGSTVVIVGTGGAGAIVLFGAAALTSRVGLSAAMKGGSYSGTEAIIDTGEAFIDVASVGTGALISKGVQKVSGRVVGRMILRKPVQQAGTVARQAGVIAQQGVREAAERTAVESAKQTTLRVVKETGESVAVETAEGVVKTASKEGAEGVAKASVKEGVETAAEEAVEGVSRRYSGKGWRAGQQFIDERWWLRIPQSGLEGAMEGAFDGFLIGAYQAGFQDHTWENGILDGFRRMGQGGVSHAGQGAIIGGSMGASFDIGLRITAPVAKRVPVIGGYVKRMTEPFVDGLDDAANGPRYMSEIAAEATDAKTVTSAQVHKRAGQVEVEAGKGNLSRTEKAQVEFEEGALSREQKAINKANLDAELQRHSGMDKKALEAAVEYRDARVELHLVRGEILTKLRQAVTEPFKNGRSIRAIVRESTARLGEARNIWRGSRNVARRARNAQKELNFQSKVSERVSGLHDPSNAELRRHTENAVRASSNAWRAVRRGNLFEAAQQFRAWQKNAQKSFNLNIDLEIKSAVEAKTNQIKEVLDGFDEGSIDPKLLSYLHDLTNKYEAQLRKSLNLEGNQKKALANLIRLQKFSPVDLFLRGSGMRRGSRVSLEMERHLVHSLDSTVELSEMLSKTTLIPSARNAVVKSHIASLEVDSARLARKENLKAVFGDLIKLRPITAARNLGGYFINLRRTFRGRAIVRELQVKVDTALYATRAANGLDLTQYGLIARKYGSARARLANDLRFFTNPIESARDFAVDLVVVPYRFARNLAGLSSPPARFRRNPLRIVPEAIEAYRASRTLQRGQREAVLQGIQDKKLDVAQARIFKKLGNDSRFERVAMHLAEQNRERLLAWRRFKNSFRDLRDRLIAGKYGDTRSLREVAGSIRETFDAWKLARLERSRAYDSFLMAKRQRAFEARGMDSSKARMRARKEVLARRMALRGNERDLDRLLYERVADLGAGATSAVNRAVLEPLKKSALAVRDAAVVTGKTAVSAAKYANPVRAIREGGAAVDRLALQVADGALHETATIMGAWHFRLANLRALYAVERIQQVVSRLGIPLPGAASRDGLVNYLRRAIERSKENILDLAEEQALRRAVRRFGGDAKGLADPMGRGGVENLASFERYITADALLARSSWVNPLHWYKRMKAVRTRHAAQGELYELKAHADRVRYAAHTEKKLLASRGRDKLDPQHRQDKEMRKLASRLAKAEARVKMNEDLINHEILGLGLLRAPDKARLARYNQELQRVTRRRDLLRAEFKSLRRVEFQTAKLHAQAGGSAGALEAARNLAKAREAVRFGKYRDLRVHLLRGEDFADFSFQKYDQALAEARFEFDIAKLRKDFDYYRALADEAKELSENVAQYVERIAKQDTPFGRWLEKRRITARLRSLSRFAESDLQLVQALNSQGYRLASGERIRPFLADDVDAQQFLRDHRLEVERMRAQHPSQSARRRSEISDELDNTGTYPRLYDPIDSDSDENVRGDEEALDSLADTSTETVPQPESRPASTARSRGSRSSAASSSSGGAAPGLRIHTSGEGSAPSGPAASSSTGAMMSGGSSSAPSPNQLRAMRDEAGAFISEGSTAARVDLDRVADEMVDEAPATLKIFNDEIVGDVGAVTERNASEGRVKVEEEEPAVLRMFEEDSPSTVREETTTTEAPTSSTSDAAPRAATPIRQTVGLLNKIKKKAAVYGLMASMTFTPSSVMASRATPSLTRDVPAVVVVENNLATHSIVRQVEAPTQSVVETTATSTTATAEATTVSHAEVSPVKEIETSPVKEMETSPLREMDTTPVREIDIESHVERQIVQSENYRAVASTQQRQAAHQDEQSARDVDSDTAVHRDAEQARRRAEEADHVRRPQRPRKRRFDWESPNGSRKKFKGFEARVYNKEHPSFTVHEPDYYTYRPIYAIDLQFRKMVLTKVKNFFGEYEVVEWLLPIYF